MQESKQQAEIGAKKQKNKKKKVKNQNDTSEIIKQKTSSNLSPVSVETKTERNKLTKESESNVAEKKNLKNPKGKIVFDEECVTKYEAQNLIKEKDSAENNIDISTTNEKNQLVNKKKRKKKKRKTEEEFNHPDTTVNDEDTSEKIVVPKKKKQKMTPHNEIEDSEEKQELDEGDKPEGEKSQSIRARKRTRHLKLLEDKKLKSELNIQQKCLNYLSQWKHDKSTWKFEKLKQVWLLQNLYEDAKIPDEFWDTTVKYFNSAKGKVKEVLLAEALKIIENSDKNDEANTNVKYERARYLVQNLQE